MGDNAQRKSIANHILPTASNLLGLCFVILSLMKATKAGDQTILDESIGVAIVLFLFSSFFSYASLRAKQRGETYERVADILFLAGLVSLAGITFVVILEIVG
jgi:hypothetical protein